MSIPLDRLYNFLESQNGCDIIIYRFLPHGSKKVEDLLPLHDYESNSLYSWAEQMTMPHMIYHDQEPLKFDHYSRSDFEPSVQHNHNSKWLQDLVLDSDMHLRSLYWAMALHCYDRVLLCHSERNSADLTKYESAGFQGVYWWSHAVLARDWFRYAEHDPVLVPNFDNIQHDFLVYNRAWSGTREYRLTLAEMIVQYELADNCAMSFNPVDAGNHYGTHKFTNPALQINSSNLQDFFDSTLVNGAASADYNNTDYASSAIELVLETLFDDSRQQLTEKALRPIACGRPFLLASTAGSLKYLQDYGFETFDGLIDETYDNITDPVERLQTIAKEMKKIANLPADHKRQLWQDLYAIAKRNQQRFFSAEWHRDIVDEYIGNVKSALNTLQQHRTGRHWQQVVSARAAGLTLTKPNAIRTDQAFAEIAHWLTQ